METWPRTGSASGQDRRSPGIPLERPLPGPKSPSPRPEHPLTRNEAWKDRNEAWKEARKREEGAEEKGI